MQAISEISSELPCVPVPAKRPPAGGPSCVAFAPFCVRQDGNPYCGGPLTVPVAYAPGAGRWTGAACCGGAGMGCALEVAGACSCTPIDCPETTIDTRRFSARPALVPLSATGLAFPYPSAVMFPGCTPWEIRNACTAVARSCESFRLYSSDPMLSV